MPDYSTIQVEIKDRVGYLTLNRPDKRNALNTLMVMELKTALKELEADAQVKIIVLKGAGKDFCAGADLASIQAMQSNTFAQNLQDSMGLSGLYKQIYTLEKVVIAQVHGNALAGGCGLATVCDFVIAEQESFFGYPEVKIGFVPAIVSVFLARKIGEGRAKGLLLTGKRITAQEAFVLGLITSVVNGDDLEDQVNAFAQKLVKTTSGDALERTKGLIGRVQEMALEDGLALASTVNAEARQTEDCKEGISAFLEKRKPNFS